MQHFSTRLARAGEYHRTGDLVFCRDGGVISRLLRLGQRWVDEEPAAYSHVAICIYPGLLLHSVPGGGVQFLKVEARHREQIAFRAGSPDSIVLRPSYRETPALAAIQAMLFWTGQQYNFSFLKPIASISGRAYCSQLIVQILSRLEALSPDVFGDARVTPSGLFRWALRTGAADVTGSYAAYAALLASDPTEREHLLRDRPRELIVRAAAHNVRQAVVNRAIADGAAAITIRNYDAIREVAARLGELRGVSRPLKVVLDEACGHLFSAELSLRLALRDHLATKLHYLDLREVPLAAQSGAYMNGVHIKVLTGELSALADELAGLQRFMDEAPLLMDAFVDQLRSTLATVFDAPHKAFRSRRDALGGLVEEPGTGTGCMGDLGASIVSLFAEYAAVIDLYNALLLRLNAWTERESVAAVKRAAGGAD